MKAVGSRLERGHDDGSSGAAELSGSHAGLDAKLVNRVSRRKENDGVDQGFVVVNSIEDEIVIFGSLAIDVFCLAPSDAVENVAVVAGSVGDTAGAGLLV